MLTVTSGGKAGDRDTSSMLLRLLINFLVLRY